MKWNIKDMNGLKFGMLTVVGCEGTDSRGIVRWLCQCECGETKIIPGYVLRRGASNSCGCFRRKIGGDRLRTHGKSRSRVYRIWNGMIRRCTDPRHKDYSVYGAKGITVCSEWLDFPAFYRDMGDPPSPKHEIDRKENSEGYFKENCRWVTCKQNQRNRRSNRSITFDGETKLLVEWAEDRGISAGAISARIKAGWSIEQAITKPTKKYGR